MARPREFEEDVVLDRAADTFRNRGYAGTSIADLEQATGVQRGSLYKAFGDKQGLYQQALRRYRTRGAERLAALHTADPVLPAIRQLLVDLAADGCQPPRRSCMVVAAATERGADATSAGQVQEQLEFMRAGLRDALERAVVLGEMSHDADTEGLALTLLALLQGLRVLAAARGDLEELLRVVDQTFAAFPLPQRA